MVWLVEVKIVQTVKALVINALFKKITNIYFYKMTSLYDQYHSQKNIDYIYNLLDDLIKKQNNGISIKADIDFKDYYLKQLRDIFIKSESDNLVDLNKELLKHHMVYYINKNDNIKSQNIAANTSILNKPKIEDKIKSDNTDVNSNFNEYLKNRDIPIIKSSTPIKIEKDKELSFDDMIKDMNTQNIEIKPNILPQILEESVINKPKEKKKYVTLTSANRTDIISNRFNYNLKCDKDIKQFEQLIIAIENTLHFTLPILKFKIIESNIDTNLYLQNTYDLNNYTYGVYIPKNEIIINKLSDNINIQICSFYGDIEIENDIIECELSENKDKLKPKNIVNFRVNDIISINSKYFTKILHIVEDNLVLENIPEFESDESIYIMNMNLQNTLVFS